MYVSTRGNELVTSSKAIILGLASDGGLFVPTSLDKIGFDSSWINLTYQELAFKIFRYFLDDFSDLEIKEIIDKAYSKNNFPIDIVKVDHFDKFAFLSLYYGPTFAFKDMALTILPHLLEVALKKQGNSKKTYILTATSGDTGSSSLSGFNKTKDIKTIVLYPNDGVSEIQERQMNKLAINGSYALALDGNFDDCQRIVKKIFNEIHSDKVNLASANSINIGRLIPQIVYYFWAYLDSVRNGKIRFGEAINVSVPTGNFGNILASFYAKKLGLFIDRIICASNKNNVLTDFFNSGEYNANRKFYKTISPSMDILISSNLERFLYLINDNNPIVIKELMEELKNNKCYKLNDKAICNLKEIEGGFLDEEETKETIKEVYNKYHFLIDPHTAVAMGVYLNKRKENDNYTIIASTASPFKFIKVYEELFNLKEKTALAKIKELANITNTLVDLRIEQLFDKDYETLEIKKEEVENKILEIVGIENESKS